jgi:uncharacterized protein
MVKSSKTEMHQNRNSPASTMLSIFLLSTACWMLLFYFKERIARFLVYNIFSLSNSEHLSGSLLFFIQTFFKIFLLLIMVIFVMTVIRSYFPASKIRNRLLKLNTLQANTMAGIFGAVTPFCSCSAVPLCISFLETGIPLGITLSFLIASPLVNEVIVIMLFSLFGWKVALYYAIAGLLIAITSGIIIGKLSLERFLPIWLLNFRNERSPKITGFDWKSALLLGMNGVKDILRRTWLYIIAGILVGVVIHGYAPNNLLGSFALSNHWYGIPLIVLIGIPFYACSASIAPIAFALTDKGVPLGYALAFTMAVAGLSLPEFIMLRKVLSIRLLLIFIGIVYTGIVCMGFIFNWTL